MIILIVYMDWLENIILDNNYIKKWPLFCFSNAISLWIYKLENLDYEMFMVQLCCNFSFFMGNSPFFCFWLMLACETMEFKFCLYVFDYEALNIRSKYDVNQICLTLFAAHFCILFELVFLVALSFNVAAILTSF